MVDGRGGIRVTVSEGDVYLPYPRDDVNKSSQYMYVISKLGLL